MYVLSSWGTPPPPRHPLGGPTMAPWWGDPHSRPDPLPNMIWSRDQSRDVLITWHSPLTSVSGLLTFVPVKISAACVGTSHGSGEYVTTFTENCFKSGKCQRILIGLVNASLCPSPFPDGALFLVAVSVRTQWATTTRVDSRRARTSTNLWWHWAQSYRHLVRTQPTGHSRSYSMTWAGFSEKWRKGSACFGFNRPKAADTLLNYVDLSPPLHTCFYRTWSLKTSVFIGGSNINANKLVPWLRDDPILFFFPGSNAN